VDTLLSHFRAIGGYEDMLVHSGPLQSSPNSAVYRLQPADLTDAHLHSRRPRAYSRISSLTTDRLRDAAGRGAGPQPAPRSLRAGPRLADPAPILIEMADRRQLCSSRVSPTGSRISARASNSLSQGVLPAAQSVMRRAAADPESCGHA